LVFVFFFVVASAETKSPRGNDGGSIGTDDDDDFGLGLDLDPDPDPWLSLLSRFPPSTSGDG